MAVKHLNADQIRIDISLKEGTQNIKPETLFPGQERVEKAFNVGLSTEKEGYNIYVAGPEGIGKVTYSLHKIKNISKQKKTPEDICYYNNFEEPYRPKYLLLPAGYGKKLSRDLDRSIDTLKEAVVKQFESKEFEDEKVKLIKNAEEKRKNILEQLKKEAESYGLAMVITPAGIQLLPIVQGKVSPEFLKIPEIKTEFEKKVELFDETFRKYLRELRDVEHTLIDSLNELKKKVSEYIVENVFYRIEEKYKDIKQALIFIRYIKEKIAERIDLFIRWKILEGDFFLQRTVEREFNLFRLNVIVDNSKTEGAPYKYEEIPTFKTVFGHIAYKAEMGILYADHMSITAGSLLKVRGGYLLLRAVDIIKNPFLWEALKRSILHKKVYISQHLVEEVFPFQVGIFPEPVPFDVTIILVGDNKLYNLLSIYDFEFNRLFKVKAEFDPVIKLTEEVIQSFPRIVKKIVTEEKMKDLTADALSELLRYSIQLSGNRKRINVVFSHINDIVREADSRSDGDLITGKDIKLTIKEKIFRENLVEEKIRELFKEGILIIDIEGKKVGQVNGLTVYDLGNFRFGKPSRITASSYIGEKGIISIEREVELSGPIYDKGVLILSGYIGSRYGKDTPLTLSCSITFEQSYGEVEGDSASAAELIAVLSSIGDIQIRQDLAITGSIDQHGNIQPVGGIKEKVEGFYRVCKIIGLTGEQGVIVPSRNIDNIILDDDVIKSIEKGEFHIYTVDHIDDVIQLTSGMKPLEFHQKVKEELIQFYEKVSKGKK